MVQKIDFQLIHFVVEVGNIQAFQAVLYYFVALK